MRLDTALRLWGERTFARDIARDLRCSRCGARAASTQTIADLRHPCTIKENPGGGFATGPDWPIVDIAPAPATRAVKVRGWDWFAEQAGKEKRRDE
jgi:hypothetical protein